MYWTTGVGWLIAVWRTAGNVRLSFRVQRATHVSYRSFSIARLLLLVLIVIPWRRWCESNGSTNVVASLLILDFNNLVQLAHRS
jgi:hypothetical protein